MGGDQILISALVGAIELDPEAAARAEVVLPLDAAESVPMPFSPRDTQHIEALSGAESVVA